MPKQQDNLISDNSTKNPFELHGKIRVSKSGTYLEHSDGTPFFFLSDTCWSGPALSGESDWLEYLADRKEKGFTAIQFNMASPWRAAVTDAEGRQSYRFKNNEFLINEDFYTKRLDSRLKAINDIGLLAVPVLCWDHMKGDAGKELNEENLMTLIKFQVDRYKDIHTMWILAGDSHYNTEESERWKRIGRAVFRDNSLLVTTHPSGENWPWGDWENEKWLNILAYQSGHGDSDEALNWIHHGPHVNYNSREGLIRPIINLEPPYEGLEGHPSKEPHLSYNVRRAVYWSLMVNPIAGISYGGHGVWSWHTKIDEEPTAHPGTGIAKSWREAIDFPGANEMGLLRNLFESLPWTQLRPAQELLSQNNNDPGKFASSMVTLEKDLIVVYFPIGAQSEINIPLALIESTTWFNPSSGETKTGELAVPNSKNDWLLVIRLTNLNSK